MQGVPFISHSSKASGSHFKFRWKTAVMNMRAGECLAQCTARPAPARLRPSGGCLTSTTIVHLWKTRSRKSSLPPEGPGHSWATMLATATLGQPWGAAQRPAPQQACAAPSPSKTTILLCNFLEPKLCLTYARSSSRLTVFKLSCSCCICTEREMLCLSASQDRQSTTDTEVTILCVTT